MHADVPLVSIAPVEVLQEAWARIRGQYWLFLGICAVGMLLGSMAPLGILMGPMMCGIYLCFLDQARGEPVAFERLFKGFQHFKEAFLATLVMIGVGFLMAIPLALGLVFLGLATAAAGVAGHVGPETPFLLLLVIMGGAVVFMVFSVVVGLLFTFTFPLIVHRGMEGFAAVKLSARAALANFWGLLGLGLLNLGMGMLGLCCCYVGAFLVMPLTLASHWVAYERIFGPVNAGEAE